MYSLINTVIIRLRFKQKTYEQICLSKVDEYIIIDVNMQWASWKRSVRGLLLLLMLGKVKNMVSVVGTLNIFA